MLKSFVLLLKGLILGISMVLPGLSGGTMAFILGIYERLIGEISKTNQNHLKALFNLIFFKKKDRKKNLLLFGKSWDWAFLLPLIAGIFCAIFLFVAFASPFIEKYSLQFYSIVFALVLASLFKPFQEIKKTLKTFGLILLSFLINILLFSLGDTFTFFPKDISFFLFLPIGFVISIALIIPGLSGSYLLLIFGVYEKTLGALRDRDFLVIVCFLIGLIIGCFSVARLVQYLIKNYFNETIAIIIGLILGSLYVIYPLPKESLDDLLLYDLEKKIFLTWFISTFLFCISFSLLSFFKRD